MSKKSKTRKDLEKAERAKKALQLRLAGASYREIGDTLDIAPSTAYEDVSAALADIPKQEADELRNQEAERLDRLQRAVWTEALTGDLPSVDRAVKIIDRRAKLLGLDAPQRLEVSSDDVDLDATVQKILAAAQVVADGGPEAEGDEIINDNDEEQD